MNSRLPNSLTYRDSGVDIDKGNALVERIGPLAAATKRLGADASLGGFGGVFDIGALGLKDPLLVSATDGVGTKLALAQQLDRHDTIGIDLVAMCVNDILAQGAEPLYFLDYFATGHLSLDTAEAVISGIADGCRQAGCALIGGETAEMPGMYEAGTYDLAGFAVGAVERDDLLPRAGISAGDILIGVPSSGLHSNGFSLMRKVIDVLGIDLASACPFHGDRTWGDIILAPTRIYADVARNLTRTGLVNGIAHITGGGLTENVPRIVPDALSAQISLPSWPLPPLFSWLRSEAGIEDQELRRTFNCGIGLVAAVPADAAEMCISSLAEIGEQAYAIGELVPRNAGSADGIVFTGNFT